MFMVMRRIALKVVVLLAMGALPIAACTKGALFAFQDTSDNYEITLTRGWGWSCPAHDRATAVALALQRPARASLESDHLHQCVADRDDR